ncbi:MAG: glycosyltransferase family 4 protein [Bacteroidales bacterium]|nr:glycosyltransferase family 4 protein [Bacteroidales bacterium]
MQKKTVFSFLEQDKQEKQHFCCNFFPKKPVIKRSSSGRNIFEKTLGQRNHKLNKKMKKTLAIVASRNELNSYIKEQYESLKEYFDVVWGLDFFWEENFYADYYLIHWPEYITNFYNKKFDSVLETIKERLISIKNNNSKLIGIYHNKFPHYNNTEGNRKLYETFYSMMDGVICLGYYSANYYKSTYKNFNTQITIIPHPCFNSIPNTISREDARKNLSINKDNFVILIFGSLRNKEEVKLFLRAFKDSNIKNKKLLVVGGKIDHYSSIIEKIYNKIYRFWHAGKNLIYIDRKVDDNELQKYFNASDVVFIPRTDTLNSGVVFMAFTFGKPVIGPSVGNITETLKDSGNILFNPNNRESIANALNLASTSNLNEISQNNISLSKTIFSTQNIAYKISNFIISL